MPDIAHRIVADPAIVHGKLVIKGTRVPVEIILGHLAARMTPEEVAEEYDIAVGDVYAALSYAARVVGAKRAKSKRPG